MPGRRSINVASTWTKTGSATESSTARWVSTMPRPSCLTRVTKPRCPVSIGGHRPASPQYSALMSGSFRGIEAYPVAVTAGEAPGVLRDAMG